MLDAADFKIKRLEKDDHGVAEKNDKKIIKSGTQDAEELKQNGLSEQAQGGQVFDEA